MDDRAWEMMLQDELSQMPLPEDMLHKITPWRPAMKRVLIGLFLNMFTLQFFCLQYILPAIGLIMILLGFRTLRRTNRWFSVAWIAALVEMTVTFPIYWINTTYWYEAWMASPLARGINGLVILLEGILLLCLWQGVRTVQKQAGMTPHAGSGAALLFWYLALLGLAVLGAGGWLVTMPMLIAYVMILFHLYRLSYELEEAGYAVEAAPVKISDGWVVTGIVGIMTAGFLLGQLGFSAYPMEWTEVEEADAGTVQEIRQIKKHLLTLGFPEVVLEDLSEEDILACKEASYVFSESEEEVFAEKRFISREADRRVEITMVAVQVSENPVKYRFFHHFLWPDEGGMLQRDAVEIGPAYKEDEMWALTTDCTGYALYDQGETVYMSSLYGITEKNYGAEDLFGDSYGRNLIWAGVSYPAKNAGQCRGYLTYEAVAFQQDWRILATTYYYHQTDWFQYPFQSKLKHSFSRLDGYYGQWEYEK